jgi:hypothetical protein
MMKPLPRAKPGKPGSISPDAWNLLVDAVEEMKKTTAALMPRKSPDIVHKHSKNGFTSHLTRRRGHTPTPPPPYAVYLSSPEPDSYEVSVGYGYVCTRIAGTGDAIQYTEAENWEADGAPAKFPISVAEAVYVKVEVDPNDVIQSVVIEVASDNQTSLNPVPGTNSEPGTDGYYYFKLAVLDPPEGDGTAPVLTRWMAGSHIDHYLALSSSHPWKVTPSASEGWHVVGGTVYTQGAGISVLDDTVDGDDGFVCLKITRDDESREMTAAVIEFQATVPESTYTEQYTPLAQVDKTGSPQVIQLKFEEIRIRELMIVENGAWRLAPVDLSSREIYELPP